MKSEMRIEMIPKLLNSLYEDKLNGKTTEENYSILPSEYADIREGVAVEYVSCEPTEGWKELFPEQYGVEDGFEEEETEQA